MEPRMRQYIIKRINQKLKEGKTNTEIIEQLQALDSKKSIEQLLKIVTNPVLKSLTS